MKRQTIEIAAALAGVAVLVGIVVAVNKKQAAASTGPQVGPGNPATSGGNVPKAYTFQQGHSYRVTVNGPAGATIPSVGGAFQIPGVSNLTVSSTPQNVFTATFDWTGATATIAIPMNGQVTDLGPTPGATSPPVQASGPKTVTLIPGTQQAILFAGNSVVVSANGGTIKSRRLSIVKARAVDVNAPTDTLGPFAAPGRLVYNYSWVDSGGTPQDTILTVIVG